MTNLELATEKLEAARIVLGAAYNYLETAQRLIAESSTLTDEAERLLEGDTDGANQRQQQRQLQAPHAGGTADALSGDSTNHS